MQVVTTGRRRANLPWRHRWSGAGFYRVNLLIDKALTLRGLRILRNLSGGHQGDTIPRDRPGRVVLEGLIVRDSGTSLKDQNAGIYLCPGAHRAVVPHCDLTYQPVRLVDRKPTTCASGTTCITGKRDVNLAATRR